MHKGREYTRYHLFHVGANSHSEFLEHLMSVNGDEAEWLIYLDETLSRVHLQMFSHSVQKLPSISRSSKCLSANGHFSLGSLVMYSSFSLPLSIITA